MIKNKNILTLTGLFLTLIIILNGCMGLSRDERRRLSTVKYCAKKYYFRKYKENPVFYNANYQPHESVIPWPKTYDKDDDIYVSLNNNVEVLYHAENQEFSDNKQSREINNDFLSKKWNPFLTELGEYYLTSNFLEKSNIKHCCKLYSKWDESTFNELYDGDIDKYCSNVVRDFDYCGNYQGKYSFYCGEFDEEMYIVANSLSEYNKKYNKVIKLLKKHKINKLHGPVIHFMTKDILEKEKLACLDDSKDKDHPSFTKDYGYWGEYNTGFSDNYDLFLKLAKGIYGAIDLNDDVNSNDRVELKTCKSELIKNEFGKNNSSEKYKKFFYSIELVTPLYKIIINKKTLKEFADITYDDCYLHLMLDYNKLKFDDNSELYLYNNQKNKIKKINFKSKKSIAKVNLNDLKKGNSYLFIAKKSK